MKQSVNSHFILPYCEYTYNTRKIRSTFSSFCTMCNFNGERVLFLDARILYYVSFINIV